jgi:hypothetical protein
MAWTPAAELQVGDTLRGETGDARVEAIEDTGEYTSVYNCRVAEWHTYFVGCQEWGFSVWAHNVYDTPTAPKRLSDRLSRVVVDGESLPASVRQRIQDLGAHRYVDGATGDAWAAHWSRDRIRSLLSHDSPDAMMAQVMAEAKQFKTGAGKVLLEQIESVTPSIAYTRSAYGNPMNSADMTALKNANKGLPCPTCRKPQLPASPEHDPALGIHWFIGDGVGSKPGIRMTQLEREAYAASRASASTTLCVSCNKAGGNAVSAQVDALTRQYMSGTLWWQKQGLFGG